MEQNSGRLHNTIRMATGAAHNPELLIEEFQSIFTFRVAGLYGRGEIARLSTFMVGTQQM
jgi:hypothetical protein